MFDISHNYKNNWRWDNPRAFGDQAKGSNSQTTSLGKVKCNGDHFSSYRTNDIRAKSVLPTLRPFKLGDFLTVSPLNWNEIIAKDVDAEDWADPGVPSSGKNRPGDGNDNDDGEGEEDMQGGQKQTRKGKATKDGKGK